MTYASVALTLLLAAILIFAALRKLSHDPEVVESYRRTGVPEERLNSLAAILLVAAAGLIAGIAWGPVGVAAAAGVAVYFLVAISFHIRFDDLGHVGTPVALEAIALIAGALRIAAL